MSDSLERESQAADLYTSLRAYYSGRADVWVGANNFIYYAEGDVTKRVSPDVVVVLGVRDRPVRARGSYKIWEEGVPPTFALELASPKTHRNDRTHKRDFYARLGVAEYYLFDPLGGLLLPRLQGYHLDSSRHYMPVVGPEIDSPALGLRLVVIDEVLRLIDSATGRLLPTKEEQEALITAQEMALEQKDVMLAAQEAELARLRAELVRLRGDGSA